MKLAVLLRMLGLFVVLALAAYSSPLPQQAVASSLPPDIVSNLGHAPDVHDVTQAVVAAPGTDSSLAPMAPAALLLTKSDGLETWPTSYNFTYTIFLQNANPFPVSNVVVTDVVPLELIVVAVPAGAVQNADFSVTWRLGELAASESRQLQIMMRSLTRVRGPVINTVVAGADGAPLATSSDTTVIVDLPPPVSTPTFTPTPALVPLGLCLQEALLRVNAGSSTPYVAGDGQSWLPDQPYTGTTTWGYVPATSPNNIYATGRAIAGVVDQPLYQSERWWPASGGYRIDLPNGYYRVVLKFAEIYPWATRGSRMLDVTVQGYPLLTGLDLAATAGLFVGYDVTLDTPVQNGVLSIDISNQVGNPMLNAMAVLPLLPCIGNTPTPTSTPTPTATPTVTATPAPGSVQRLVNAGGDGFVDTFGQAWLADQAYTPGGWGYIGGETYRTTMPIDGTAIGILYQSERWWTGSGSYRFTVPNGMYSVALKFAEIYPYTYRGSRIFDVRVEGNAVRRNLDLFSVAGRYTAYDVVVPGVLVADELLHVDLLPRVGSPKLSAIHILLTGP